MEASLLAQALEACSEDFADEDEVELIDDLGSGAYGVVETGGALLQLEELAGLHLSLSDPVVEDGENVGLVAVAVGDGDLFQGLVLLAEPADGALERETNAGEQEIWAGDEVGVEKFVAEGHVLQGYQVILCGSFVWPSYVGHA